MHTNFQQFPIKWSYEWKLLNKIVSFYYQKKKRKKKKMEIFVRIAPLKAPFYFRLFKIGMRSARDIRKDVPILHRLYLGQFYSVQRQVVDDFLDAVYSRNLFIYVGGHSPTNLRYINTCVCIWK